MKLKHIIIYTCIGIALSAFAFAQKTEVSVKQGKVTAQTTAGSATINAGQMATLTPNNEPQVGIDEPFVKDILQMAQWARAEIESNKRKIEKIGVIAARIDDENHITGSVLMEIPNTKSEPVSELCLGPVSLLRDPRIYDMDGTALEYKLEKESNLYGYYYLYFPYQVAPGEKFRFICVSKDNSFTQHFAESESGWEFWGANNGSYALNFWRFVLPESAVFLRSEPSPITTDEVDGRVTITIRHYTGKTGNGVVKIYFHWPEHDNMLLSDLPWLNAGSEAVTLYEYFLAEDIKTAALWGELGIKLVGGRFWDEALEAFVRCQELGDSEVWEFTSLVWQGHIYDLFGDRKLAVEKYQAALEASTSVVMQHDQWGMVLSKYWVEKMIDDPFTEDLLATEQSLIESLGRDPNELLALKESFDNLPWNSAGPEAVEIYHKLKELDLDHEFLGAGWFTMGIKLAGGGYFGEAFDCFSLCERLTTNPTHIRAAYIWLGHMYDLQSKREEALENYNAAAKAESAGYMRHDQWGIVLDEDWVKARLETPFTKEMIGK